MGKPDFYLASVEGSESSELKEPRCCWRIKRLATDSRDDLLLIRIAPPLIGQSYGLGGRDIDLVLIAPRYQGQTLFPVSEWPAFVHVARPLIDDIENRDHLRDDEYELIVWAELYRTEKDALLKAM